MNTRGPIGPFSGPHSWEEESSRSASTDEIIRHHRRRDFEDILPEPPGMLKYMGLITTKPVIRVSDNVNFKPVSSTTETS